MMRPILSVFAFVTALALLVAPTPAAAQAGPAKVEIKTLKVSEGLFVFMGGGGNVGLAVGPDGAFLIDDKITPVTPALREAIRKVTDKPIRFVLNTHWHRDHVGGNEAMAAEGAVIVAHENVRKRMSVPAFLKRLGKIPASPARALPLVTFTRDVKFHLAGDTIEVFYVTPAHTDGDVIVRFVGKNVIHMGDTLVTEGYPFVDEESGGVFDGFLTVADRVLAVANAKTKIIPGHGPLADRARLEAWKKMLGTIRERVAKAVAEGKSLAEITAMKPTKDYDAIATDFVKPDDLVKAVHAAVTAKKPR